MDPTPREAWVHVGLRAGSDTVMRRVIAVPRPTDSVKGGDWSLEWLPFDPVPGEEFRADAAGNEALRNFLASWRVESERVQPSAASGTIDADHDVPLQEIIALIEVFRAAGLEEVGFAVPR